MSIYIFFHQAMLSGSPGWDSEYDGKNVGAGDL